MKRNEDLMLEILVHIEEHDSIPDGLDENGWSHVKYLHKEGFINGKPVPRGIDEVYDGFLNPQLTEKGHDFIKAFRKKSS